MTNKTFLEQLYYGNVMPFDKKTRRGSKVDKISKIAEAKCDEFREKLSDELKKEFDNVLCLQASQMCESELEAFIFGCRFIFRPLGACCGDENNDFLADELLQTGGEII